MSRFAYCQHTHFNTLSRPSKPYLHFCVMRSGWLKSTHSLAFVGKIQSTNYTQLTP